MADRTFTDFILNFLAELPTVDNTDYLLAFDTQTGTPRKVKTSALPTSSSGGGTTPTTAIATSGAAQSLAFPANGDVCYDITLSANCTITLTGGTGGEFQTMTLILRNQGGFAPTLPATIKWQGGVAPVPNTLAGKIDKYMLSTPDAGVTVFGAY